MESLVKKIVWLMAGMILVYLAAATAATGSFHADSFYDAGQVDEVYPLTLQTERPGFLYQNPGDDFFTVTEEYATEAILITQRNWNYIVLDTSLVNRDLILLDITACDENWNARKTQRLEVKGGKQIFPCELPKSRNLLLAICGQEGAQFQFYQLQFRMKQFNADKKKMATAGALASVFYIFLSIGVVWLKKKRQHDVLRPFRKSADRCFSCYLQFVLSASGFLYRIAENSVCQWDVRLKSAIRIVLMAFWISAEIVLRGTGLRLKAMGFHYALAMITTIVFSLTALEKKPRKLQWNNLLAKTWFWLSVIMVVSGFFVPKRWPCVGLLFLFVYGIWFFIWGNMQKPCRILSDVCLALKGVFWATVILSMFGRTYMPAQPYAGIYVNQNVFAAFLIMMMAVNLSQFYQLYQKQETYFLRSVLLGLELCLMLFFLVSTQSRIGWMTGVGVLLIFFQKTKRRLLFVLQLLVLFLPVSFFTDWAFLHVQESFPYRIEYAKAELEEEAVFLDTYEFGETVHAAESENVRKTSAKVAALDNLTSGRITLWKAYIRKFNLWGHRYREKINGVFVHSHNAFSYMIYLYGILSLIPYAVMWMMIFVRSNRFAKRMQPYGFFPLALAVGFFIHAMIDTLEEPFAMESWIIVYFIIGILFHEDVKKKSLREGT